MADGFWTGYATIRGDAEAFHPDYIADRKRTSLLLRAVIADRSPSPTRPTPTTPQKPQPTPPPS